ncbi:MULTISPECIES: response regulator transcription factor [Mesotoga]|uniref:Response regulator with CheY-like receiver domain and winged-helix DNA-binding domain n=1 Tax=Mesotoga prima MesG1.Ag.4.2 TaxID=660470 RepID=I2F540_9BACT|nr:MULTISPECIES: response regulator transcription factor [Mesotoga]MCP5457482.1 response regulator transcription factor [Thermotogota bacterium]CCU83686.1 Response regulator mprA [Mesotoga infera]AFK07043.1 response regulator with CheY-like receiver domain and winged-helix DNA-binding domain [Mesotoga prima MesG1.Ag.4.2]MCP5460847.1 response regulator transcription factor [Thermotogota bacterium]RLL91970.1 response regulator ArlR [Mesotoga sp. HF07.pep.5.2.highcov]
MKGRIMVVEDDMHIGKLLRLELGHEGYEVEVLTDGKEALKHLEKELPDLLILDVMLPGLDGFSVLEEIREYISTDLPVIMLTAKGEVKDRIRGLKSGADDYLPKPFVIEELLARIEAVLRRKGKVERISYFEITLDMQSREAFLNGEPLQLSKTEFDLLAVLLSNAGIVMSKERLLEKVWGSEDWGNPNVVEVYINYLRKKLGKTGERIKTVRGSGYVVR